MNRQKIKEAIEVIKEFKHFADLVESPDEYFQHMQGHTKELSLILNVFDVADLCDDITKLLQHQLTNGWIPVSENLPEYEQHVILLLNNGEKVTQVVGYLKSSDDERFNNQFSVYDGCTMPDYLIKEYVKAWQPLPEPYTE